MNKLSLLTSFAFLLLGLVLHGQVLDTIELEDVTVSVMPFNETYLETTGGVYKVTSENIEREYTITSSELFNRAPGVHMASGSMNTHRLVIRGVGSRTPYNSNRIRAYLDDIPLTTGDGITTLEDMDLFSVGSIEVLKGPSSALYGSGLGGIIRLLTPYPENDGYHVRFSGEYGSFSTRRYGLTASYKSGNKAVTGGITRSATNGFRENGAYARNSAFLNARFFAARHTVSVTFSMVDLLAGIPSSLNETDFISEPWKAGGSWGRISGSEEYIRILGGATIESDLTVRVRNRFSLFSTYSDPYERRPFNTLDDRTANVGFRETLEYKSGRMNVSSGLEYFHEWYQWQIYETLTESKGMLLSDHGETRRYLNVYALFQWRPMKKILIDGGLNVNLLGYSLTTHYRIDSTDQSGRYNYQPVLSPRIGISYNHSNKIYTYLSAGHGFSHPSLEETLLPEGTINTSLRPESGWNLEMGNRGNILMDRFNYDIALYSILLDDLLVTERFSEDIFTGVNAGKALNTGIEILLRGDLRPVEASKGFNAWFTIGYNLAHNRFVDFEDDGNDYRGNQLPGIPIQELHAELSGRMNGVHMKMELQHTGRQWMDDANSLSTQGYQLLNMHAGWDHRFSFAPLQISFYTGIRNILDTKYASMILINAPSFGGQDPRYYYPGLPRHFYLGMVISLGNNSLPESD